MQLRLPTVLIFTMTGSTLMFAESKRNWQDAKVLNVDSEHFTTHGAAQTNGQVDGSGNLTSTTTQSSWGHERWYYVIDTGKYLITATELLNWRWSKPAHVIVGENVKWDMHKRDVFILDLDDKEHKLSLKKQALKPTDSAKPQ